MNRFVHQVAYYLHVALVCSVTSAYGYREYTWTGKGAVDASGNHIWCDSANWGATDGSSPGFVSPGVPVDAGTDTRAAFPKGCRARVSIPQSFELKYLNLAAQDVDVTITSEAGSSNVVLTTQLLVTEGATQPITLRLKKVGVNFTNGTFYFRPNYHFLLTESDLTVKGLDQWFANGTIEIDRSSLHCTSYTLGNVGTKMTIKDGWLDISGAVKFGSTADGGILRFEGRNPLMTVKGASFASATAKCFPTIEFAPGAGGFAGEPIRSTGSPSGKFLAVSSGGSEGSYSINIDPACNLFKTDSRDIVPLVSWKKGVDKSRTVYNAAGVSGVTFYGTESLDPIDWKPLDQVESPLALGVTVTGSSGQLVVTGSPEEYGDPANYGVITGFSSGDSRTFTMEAVMDETETTSYTPTNWTRMVLSPEADDYVPVESGVGVCNYVHPTPSVAGKLVWNWAVENKIVAVGGVGGTVSPEVAWCPNDSAVAFTAEPTVGYSFYCWQDANGAVLSYDAVYECPGTAPCEITAVFKSDICVDPEGDDGANGDAEHPLKSLSAALAKASAGSTIVLFAGTHELAAEVTLGADVTIKGATGNPADVTVCAAEGLSIGLFTLNFPNAVLRDLTIAGGKRAASGGAVVISTNGGVVRNCVFRDNKTRENNTSGGAVYLNSDAATVSGCVFSNNCAYVGENGPTYDYGGGEAVYLVKGRVEKSLFARNGEEDVCYTLVHKTKGGIVKMTGGTLESCTFAANRHPYCAGVWATGGVVSKCLFGNNTSSVGLSATSATWFGKADCFRDCAAPVEINDSCRVVKSSFLCAEAEDWRPTVDAAGTGCVDLLPGEFVATVYPSVREGVSPLTVVWTVKTEGDRAVSCQWDWDGDGQWDPEVTDGSTEHEFLSSSCVKVRVTDVATSACFELGADIPVKVSPKTIYVSAKSTAAASPYATWDTAAHTVAEALDAAAEGSEIVVTNDTYELTSEIVVDKNVTLRGLTGNPENVIFRRKDGANVHSRIIRVSAPEAVVCGVTAENGMTMVNGVNYARHGSGVYVGIRGGIVSNCVIRACQGGQNLCCGDGLYVEDGADGALVTHCVVSNCVRRSQYNGDEGGVGAYVRGGVVRNCLFCHNTVTCSSTTYKHLYGTVHVKGGRLENCTVVKNASFACSGIWAESGEVVNCAIGLNASDNQCGLSPNTAAVWAGTADCFAKCLAPVSINDDCQVENDAASYKAPAAGDFSLNGGSAGVDNGAYAEWMDEGTDLRFAARIQGDGVDIGAYETPANVFTASFVADKTVGLLPLTATFTVTPTSPSGAVTCYWDWNGDGVYEETTTDLVKSHEFTVAGSHSVRLKVNDGVGDYVVEAPCVIKTSQRHLFVKAENANAAEPYDGWDNAGTNIADIVRFAVSGCDVTLADGDYPIDAQIELTEGIVVQGESGNPERCVVRNTASASESVAKRLFVLNAAGARVSGLTLANGRCQSNRSPILGNGGGVYIGAQGGTVSNCVVRDCSIYTHAASGSGIFIDNDATTALVTHTLVTNCQGGENDGGGAIAMRAGNVRNSIVTGVSGFNALHQRGDFGAVRVLGGTFENCTVASNSAFSCAGICCAEGGTVRNCVILGNATDAEDKSLAVFSAYTTLQGPSLGEFDHCVGEVKINESCHVSTAPETFRRFAKGDYRLKPGASAMDGGVVCDWMPGATDFCGRPRRIGPAPDCGAFECNSGLMVFIR